HAAISLLAIRPPPPSALFPYTTLFRSPEIGVFIDRARAADLGVQVIDVANALRLLVEGVDVSNYEEKGEEYEVHVRAEKAERVRDRKSTRLNSSHVSISYAVFCLKKKT